MSSDLRMPAPGEKAPEFEGLTQDGDSIRLAAYRGRKVAVYFYPKDDTPGCTKQACSLRDGYRDLLDNGIAVIGVSADDVESHAQFAEKYELPFPLVADPDHAILEKYGVWGEKNLFGRLYMGIHRTTFLIDEKGVIQDVLKQPDTDAHAEQIMDRFQTA